MAGAELPLVAAGAAGRGFALDFREPAGLFAGFLIGVGATSVVLDASLILACHQAATNRHEEARTEHRAFVSATLALIQQLQS